MAGIGSKVPGLVFKDLLTVHNSANDNEGLETNLKRVVDGEGVQSSMELSSDDMNITTHNGADKGLRLNSSLVTSSASEINNLDGKAFGGTASNDVLINSSLQTQLTDKSINGGTF